MSDETIRNADTWEGPRNEGPGGQIGPYKLLRKLGEGGFGVVFEAEQEEPVKRRVALKVIKLGMDTAEVIVRFEAERQALAMMDHPHIATVLDAGATASGRPYFVMELVEGQPITHYSDAHNLTIAQRLALFDQVCAAVQHAHSKGIIHRDLKPSNVLVHTQDGQPFAKVIDFGIAKATSGRLTDKSLMTELHQVMGTPLYMSPEQAEGSNDIDTRSDVYSLGAMLYELLTGTTPVDAASLRAAAFAEIQRLIREVDPPLPSNRLAQSINTLDGVATQRSMDPRKLTRTVRGDLDWIVMKALEKDRRRRYETANGLAMDLRRYLAQEPVLAAPPSASYRLQKFVHRHKGAVAAGSLIAASLLAGIVAFAWQARIATARAAELEQVSKFQEKMLAQLDPNVSGKGLSDDARAQFAKTLDRDAVPVADRPAQLAQFDSVWQRINATDLARGQIDRTILAPAVKTVDREFASQPLLDARLRATLAKLYTQLGDYEAAQPLAQRALAIRRQQLGADAPDTLASTNQIGEVLLYLKKPDQALPYLQSALAARRRVLGPEHPDTVASINQMGQVLYEQGKLADAEPYVRDALAKNRKVLGDDDPDTLQTMSNLAGLLYSQGKLEDAEKLWREALDRSRRVLGNESPSTLDYIGDLGFILQEQGKLDQAEPLVREALERKRHVLGEEHPDTLLSMGNLSALLLAEGKLDEAERIARDALVLKRRVLGEDSPQTQDTVSVLGVILQAEDKLGDAEPLLLEALQSSRRVLGDDHPDTLIAISNMGSLLQAEGKLDQAEPYLQEALDRRRKLLGPEHQNTLKSVANFAALRQAQHRYADVVAILAPVEAATRKAFAEGNADRLARFLTTLGMARTGLRQFPDAERELLEAQKIYVTTPGPSPKYARACHQALADLYAAWDKAEPGKGYAAKSAEWKKKAEPPPSG